MAEVSTRSAAVTARTIARLLKRAGYTMSQKTGRNKRHQTAGLYVCRVGCGNLVTVNFSSTRLHIGSGEHQSLKAEVAQARDFLLSKGYVFDNAGYIVCQKS